MVQNCPANTVREIPASLWSSYRLREIGRRPDLHFQFNPGSKAVENSYQPVKGEAIEIGIADSGEIRRGDARARVRLAYRQAIAIQHLDDFRGKQSFELVHVCVVATEVTKSVAASTDYFQPFVLYRNNSFKRLSRSLTTSISCFGVLLPSVGFFWKACTTQISESNLTA